MSKSLTDDMPPEEFEARKALLKKLFAEIDDNREKMLSEESEVRPAIEKMLAEIEHNREKMLSDQEEIDRLKARTRSMLAQLEAA